MPKCTFQIILPNVKPMYKHLHNPGLQGEADCVLPCFLHLNVLGLYDNKTPSVLLNKPPVEGR